MKGRWQQNTREAFRILVLSLISKFYKQILLVDYEGVSATLVLYCNATVAMHRTFYEILVGIGILPCTAP
jgi:hypothetical protein